MSHLALRVVVAQHPGPAPVSEHSLFAAVTAAQRIERASAVPIPEYRGSAPRVSLGGEWRRLPLESDPPSVASLPPEGDPAWQRVIVPDSFGREPALSTHFGPVYYQRRIVALPSAHQRLVFDAVDYLCDVDLDGRHLGRHEGYFAPFAFDVTELARRGALLTVRVQDPFEALDPTTPFVRHNKRVIKGTLKYHDSRPGGLPGVSTPGWDARVAQSMSTGGIQGDVRLEGTGALRVDAVFVTPLDASAGVAHLAVIVTNLTAAPREATLVVTTRPDEHGSASSRAALGFVAPPGASRLDLEGVVPGARPWWPRSHHDLGGPALHHLHVALLDGAELSDERRTRFGFRTARVTEEPKHLEVNGRSVFVQAVNYIPRQHFAGLTTAPYHEDLALCADAHVNSLGVHGHLQCPPCYDAADEAGFLVFQDFPLQWHYESGSETNPGFIDLACRQIAEMAYTFHDHPSIVYWACHNEPTALFLPGMPRSPEYDYDNQVLDEALETRLRQVEHHRHVHRASGIGDDYHLYDGSLNGGTVYGARERKSWFISEYGFWTLAPTAHRYGDVDWPPDERQFAEWLSRLSFAPWTMMYAGLPERYASLDAFRRATEAYGEFLTKYQTEWIRLNRGSPYAAYRFHFFVDWWGWAGGGLVDVDRKPKATYHALRLASRPVLVATSLPHTVFAPGSEVTFEVAAVNETRAPVDVDCAWSLHHPASCIAIGCDLEAADRLNAFSRADPGTVVAVPAEAPGPVDHGVAPLRERGRLRGRVPPESVAVLGTVTARLPETPLAALRLELEWSGERNHYQVLAAEPGWFPGPGAFVVSPGSVERLR